MWRRLDVHRQHGQPQGRRLLHLWQLIFITGTSILFEVDPAFFPVLAFIRRFFVFVLFVWTFAVFVFLLFASTHSSVSIGINRTVPAPLSRKKMCKRAKKWSKKRKPQKWWNSSWEEGRKKTRAFYDDCSPPLPLNARARASASFKVSKGNPFWFESCLTTETSFKIFATLHAQQTNKDRRALLSSRLERNNKKEGRGASVDRPIGVKQPERITRAFI